MNPVDIIIKKRDGHRLSAEEINFIISGFVSGQIPDYQMAAWAMAVFFQGMDDAETTELTQTMARSGEMLNPRQGLPADTIIVDKHSSGGIGDKTTLAVGPIVAACGLPVGKMSGRGLGFTGGTIDKLESIDGWTSELSDAQFKQQLKQIGLVVAGQTANLAPADKLIYALRDVTGTVNSLPLIASSIMSKKLAAGADAIVLDVKCGSGAFMQTKEEATALAKLMVAIGQRAGRRTTALITQMDQPLGSAIGHSLEVKEAIDTLHGRGPSDFQELVETVAVNMLSLGQPDSGQRPIEAYQAQIGEVINSGTAFEKFCQFVHAQGGDIDLVKNTEKLPSAPIQHQLLAGKAGFIAHFNAAEVGLAVVDMGGGRQKKGDAINMRVGAICHHKIGAQVEEETPLFTIHAENEADAEKAAKRIRQAVQISETATAPLPTLYGQING